MGQKKISNLHIVTDIKVHLSYKMADEKNSVKLLKKKDDPSVLNVDLSDVRNKIRRNELYQKQKAQKNKEKKKRKRASNLDGDDPAPKVQKTLDNMRVADETMVAPDDEEVLQDACTDEYASYFSGNAVPKILFTTCNRPRNYETMQF